MKRIIPRLLEAAALAYLIAVLRNAFRQPATIVNTAPRRPSPGATSALPAEHVIWRAISNRYPGGLVPNEPLIDLTRRDTFKSDLAKLTYYDLSYAAGELVFEQIHADEPEVWDESDRTR